MLICVRGNAVNYVLILFGHCERIQDLTVELNKIFCCSQDQKNLDTVNDLYGLRKLCYAIYTVTA